jgi:hypothetical protein
MHCLMPGCGWIMAAVVGSTIISSNVAACGGQPATSTSGTSCGSVYHRWPGALWRQQHKHAARPHSSTHKGVPRIAAHMERWAAHDSEVTSIARGACMRVRDSEATCCAAALRRTAHAHRPAVLRAGMHMGASCAVRSCRHPHARKSTHHDHSACHCRGVVAHSVTSHCHCANSGDEQLVTATCRPRNCT